MSAHETLYQRMITHPGLSALIGSRAYRPALPLQPTFPALTYEQISSRRVRSASGAVHVVDRFQVNCWSETPDDCDALADQVVDAFDHWMDDGGSVEIRRAATEGERDLYSGESERYRRMVDLIVARSV
jgi:hypothetical protein